MLFTFADHTFRIRFQHIHVHDESMPRRCIPLMRRRVQPKYVRASTECFIEEKNKHGEFTYTPQTKGIAYCSLSDSFVKETGRKLALTRALRSLPPEFRTAAWGAYLKRTDPSA